MDNSTGRMPTALTMARLAAMQMQPNGVQVNMDRSGVRVTTLDTPIAGGGGKTLDDAVGVCWGTLLKRIDEYKSLDTTGMALRRRALDAMAEAWLGAYNVRLAEEYGFSEDFVRAEEEAEHAHD